MIALLIGLFIGLCAAGELENLYLPPPGGYKLQEPNAYNGESLTPEEYAAPTPVSKNEDSNIDYFKHLTVTTPVEKFVPGGYRNPILGSSSANNPGQLEQRSVSDFKYFNEPNAGDGAYNFEYETESGIKQKEYGYLADEDEEVVEGSYSYTGPDGVLYTVNYRADANGFHATGAHLPTPPPIPEVILKSIRLNAEAEAEAEENRYEKSRVISSNLDAGYKY